MALSYFNSRLIGPNLLALRLFKGWVLMFIYLCLLMKGMLDGCLLNLVGSNLMQMTQLEGMLSNFSCGGVLRDSTGFQIFVFLHTYWILFYGSKEFGVLFLLWSLLGKEGISQFGLKLTLWPCQFDEQCCVAEPPLLGVDCLWGKF